MNGFRVASPWWLALLVALLVLVVLRRRREECHAALFSSATLIAGLPVSLRQRMSRLLPALQWGSLALMTLALARPQQGIEEFRVRTEGVAMLLCLDRSGSMEAMDFQVEGERVNRLEMAKRTFRDFVAGGNELRGRPDDRIGLIAFGGFVRSLCPPTLDHGVLLKILDQVEIPQPVVDESGRLVDRRFSEMEQATAIGDALARGIDRLRALDVKSKVLILLSDGKNTAGLTDPLQAAQAAQALGIKVYAIGVGTNGIAPFPVVDRFGQVGLEARRVEMDEELLQEIARSTGGEYFNVQTTDALVQVYERIDALEKTETESLLYTRHRELYLYSLVPGIVLYLLERALRLSWLAPVP